jgi:large subunit ribosomal protein L24e
MVVKRQCSFCAREIEPGTGMMFVKRDGTVYHFCTASCRKQQLHLHRVGHHFKWTRAHELKRAADRSAQKAPAAISPAKAAKGRATRRPEPPKAEGAPAPEPAVPAPAPAEAPAVSESETPATAAPPKKPRRPRKKTESKDAA